MLPQKARAEWLCEAKVIRSEVQPSTMENGPAARVHPVMMPPGAV
jgi:hypothetical protein